MTSVYREDPLISAIVAAGVATAEQADVSAGGRDVRRQRLTGRQDDA
jgi:hypothetical protein